MTLALAGALLLVVFAATRGVVFLFEIFAVFVVRGREGGDQGQRVRAVRGVDLGADHAVSVTKRVVTIVTGEPYVGVSLEG